MFSAPIGTAGGQIQTKFNYRFYIFSLCSNNMIKKALNFVKILVVHSELNAHLWCIQFN